MNNKVEQRACIKFCVKLGKNTTETQQLLQQAFGESALGKTQVCLWHGRFKRGQETLEDSERSGRPSTSLTNENVEKVRELIHEDRRRSISDIAESLGISYGSVQTILTENLNMRRIAAKFVPRLLSQDQKDRRMLVCQELKETANGDRDFLKHVITGDESWVYGYDPETKQQSSQWKSPTSPRPKKARQVRSNVKSMLIVFVDHQGILLQEFVPQGQTVNSDYYITILRRLRDRVRHKRPELWASGNWMIHHDNAPAHTSIKVQQFLARNNMAVVPHPPYSPDLAICDFFIFPRMKLRLKGRRFQTIAEIQEETRIVLHGLKKQDFQKAFQQWQGRWDRCINAKGDYFEGDGGL